MNPTERRWLITVVAVATSLLGACGGRGSATKTDTAKPASNAPAALAVLDTTQRRIVDSVTIDRSLDAKGAALAIKAKTPGGHPHKINVPARADCQVQQQVKLEVEAIKGAGNVNYRMYSSIADRWALARVTNLSHKCWSSKYELAPGQTAYWYLESDGLGGGADHIQGYLETEDGTRIKTSVFTLTQCGDGDDTGKDRDHAMPKKLNEATRHTDVCNHTLEADDPGDPDAGGSPTPVARGAATASSARGAKSDSSRRHRLDAYETYTLWIACGPDCCYADP
jgi:hypothetical protein